ncbi:class I SAM-dependent methyltransferase [Nocardioides nanhaiensis]|uniref:Methyltransferase type 11 domain-containing protein n=1 Tax=Nocardioides nanhaiensis TaxID=1476871 RepID=A0ABP8VT02_9ACTN
MSQDATTSSPRDPARSFGGVAEAYDRGRPGYPAEAVAWLLGNPAADQQLTVLELGAGTGKLTEQLVAAGHEVHATDPDEQMLAVLRRRLPDVMTAVGTAEEIPAPDSSIDVVVAGQSWHWFDHTRAVDEVRRVLKPRGRYSMVWNTRDERVPWVRKLGRLIGTQEQGTDPSEVLDASLKFIIVEHTTFSQWQRVDRRSILDLVASRSNVAVLPEHEREQKLAEVLELYDSYGRGMDGMQLPYDVHCYRSRVVKSPAPPRPPAPAVDASRDTPGDTETTAERPRVDGSTFPSGGPDTRTVTDAGAAAQPPDDGTLLIHLR